ncbi:DUF924 family protein [Aquamicrobium defluvii]|uniref:DUF924 domain-containing protein n=1 Tax=Aquamicrobium defluvii TaxID=69279 RepID=A0A011TFK3_9HYPH|nr:DUF924 family protein [Aquamicrobium defluvii]EXL02682.1 hypothetical protein BG36_13980 [Aquamicrobium defluvii]EZQ13274.1 hypothetical protein CF98_28980 [Halopseudomonas bauzanensis]
MNNNEWDEVLDFWFPEGVNPDIDAKTHQAHWFWRMQGGADDEIVARFSGLTEQAAAGGLDHWAQTPHGRLALIVILDQFSRSIWRDDERAFAHDPHALALAVEGLSNGHYAALEMSWFKVVHGLPLGHCEGPDHLQRLDRLIGLREEIAADAPVPLRPIYGSLVRQARDVRDVIASFGRHPHRNAVLGRASTPAEELYIAKGAFPHRKAFQKD